MAKGYILDYGSTNLKVYKNVNYKNISKDCLEITPLHI